MPDLQIGIARWQLEIQALTKLCGQRILIVTDGLNYDPNDDFGLTEFRSIIAATPSFGPHTISTAHRLGDLNATIAGNFNFATAAKAVTRANYDQLWLFGFGRNNNITDAERRVIAQFMEDDGGVFATGDHEDIGAAMCSNLPRIRGMREWFGIPVSGVNRHDTVVFAGKDAGFQFSDQADNVPQKTFPFYTGTAPNFVVHPVLRSPAGDIDVMPDHPHESECKIPTDLTQSMSISGKNFVEFPNGVAPVKVSMSVSGGRFLTDVQKVPVNPRCFLGITAYDGDGAGVGRIVCDSTWHHFVNINLNGTDNPFYNPADFVNGKNGLYDNFGNPTPEYKQIKKYFQNIVKWLAPINTRNCWILAELAVERFKFPLKEELVPHIHPCPWDPMVRIGKLTADAIDKRHGFGRSQEIIDDLLTINGIEGPLVDFLRDDRVDKRERHLVPAAEVKLGLLGSVMNTVALELPENPDELRKTIKTEKAFGLFGKDVLAEGLKRGIEEAAKNFTTQVRSSAKMAEDLTATARKLR